MRLHSPSPRFLALAIGGCFDNEPLPAIENLAAYRDEHRDTIAFRGGSPVVSDPATRAKLAALMEAAGKAAQASEEGKRKLRAMAEGK